MVAWLAVAGVVVQPADHRITTEHPKQQRNGCKHHKKDQTEDDAGVNPAQYVADFHPYLVDGSEGCRKYQLGYGEYR